MATDPRVINCPADLFAYQCPKNWSELVPTANPKESFCKVCKETVHLCATLDDYEYCVVKNQCVAIPISAKVFERDKDALNLKGVMLGRPSKEALEQAKRLKVQQLRKWWDTYVQSDEA